MEPGPGRERGLSPTNPGPERPVRAGDPEQTAVLDRSDAVTGWRYWQVTPTGLLRSVTQRRIDWREGRPVRAGCLAGGHRAPHPGCDCGVHATRDMDTLRERGLCLAPEALVIGTVSLWGRVISDAGGHRAEYGYPSRLMLVRELLLAEEVSGALERLGAYGVPTDTIPLEDAVTGVSAATLAFQAMSKRASRTLAD